MKVSNTKPGADDINKREGNPIPRGSFFFTLFININEKIKFNSFFFKFLQTTV